MGNTNYFNKNYYPTPSAVIDQMIEPYKEWIKKVNILEPSAGMGAILDYLTSYKIGVNASRVFACEIDQNMKATLVGKKYKVIQEDFLKYSGALDFGLIVMNPPFDNGEHHLIKSWEILRNGHVVCLLNEETIKNQNSVYRRYLVELIEQHGSVEYLGPVFESADRRTKVNVAMVRLEKKSDESIINFKGSASGKVDEIDLESADSGIEKRDFIDALCRSYQKAIDSTAAMYRAMLDFNLFVGAFCSDYEAPKLAAAFFESSRKHGYSDAHNEFAMAFQKHAWNKIFSNTKVSGLMTNKVRDKFYKWRDEMGGIDLNQDNIMMLFDAIIQQRKIIADECIVDVFDKITSNVERRATNDVWKTNSKYMVPEKFILGYVVESGWSGGLSVCWRKRDFLDDMDRAFCLVSGKSFGDIKSVFSAIDEWCRNKSMAQESEFFEFKCAAK